MNRTYWYGVGTGLVAVYLYHHFVKPRPGAAAKPIL